MQEKLAAVLEERKGTHGDFREQFRCVQNLKSINEHYRKRNKRLISAEAVEALDQIFHKISRIATGDPAFADHWRDIAGYATLIADMYDDAPR